MNEVVEVKCSLVAPGRRKEEKESSAQKGSFLLCHFTEFPFLMDAILRGVTYLNSPCLDHVEDRLLLMLLLYLYTLCMVNTYNKRTVFKVGLTATSTSD